MFQNLGLTTALTPILPPNVPEKNNNIQNQVRFMSHESPRHLGRGMKYYSYEAISAASLPS